MKAIFSDESRICIGQRDVTETFVWCHSNKMYKDDCLKKTITFPNSLMIWGCMSGVGPAEMAIHSSTVNILKCWTLHIPSVEKNE